MTGLLIVLNAVLPVFCIAGAGAALRRLHWLREEADQSLLRVTINLLIPCLVFQAILGNQALEKAANVLLAPLVGFATIALGIGVGMLAQRWLHLHNRQEQRTFAFSLGIYNYGYVPIPLVLLLFGRETAGVLFVHNVGVELAFWTFGMIMLSEGSPRHLWKRLLNPPMAAIAAALLFNFLNLGRFIPPFLLHTIDMLGRCAIPIGLILIGSTVADHMHDFRLRTAKRVLVSACLLRLGLLPILFLLLAKYIPWPTELKQVMLVQAAMPSAVFAILMAKHYHGDPATALRVVLGTSAVGLITIPLWIRIGQAWLGL